MVTFLLAVALAAAPAGAMAPPIAAARQQDLPALPPVDLALDPQALATARDIIRIGFPEDTRLAMFSRVADSLTAQIRAAAMAKMANDPGAKAIVDGKIDSFLVSGKAVMVRHIPAFMDSYAQAYAREFSQPELEAILAFVKTPAGAHFFQRSSAIVSDPAFVAANKAYLHELQPLIDKMQQELFRDLTVYFLKNPPKPSSDS